MYCLKKILQFSIICVITFMPPLFSSVEPINKKQITLITCKWAPFYAPELLNQGFLTEIVKEAFKNVNYHLDVKFMNWTLAKKLAKDNTYSGLLGAYLNKEREKDFLFSLPIHSANSIFIARKNIGAKYNGNLHNLINFKIGISKGYTYNESFDNANYLTKIKAEGPKELLSLILEKKVDVIVIQNEVAQYLLKKYYFKQIKELIALGPTLTEKKLYIAISKRNKNYKQIITDFNTGLKKVITTNKINTIIQKHHLSN